MERYYNGWSDIEDMHGDFNIGPEDVQDYQVLIASYTCANYEGHAFVLYESDGRLYEVHGSHCSCYGLEGQWEPEETTKEAILHRLDEGTWGEESEIASEIRQVLANIA